MFSKIFKFFLAHKIIAIIGILLFSGGGYFGYSQFYGHADTVSYVSAAVERGMLISSISGTGQVSASNQVDIKSTVSGDVISLNVVSGQDITSSTVIALIDDSETQKELRDAGIALENAQLDLSELLAPPDEIDVFKAESALATAKRSLNELINPTEDDLYDAEKALITAQDSLAKLKNDQAKSYKAAEDAKKDAENDMVESYEDSFNLLTTVFFDLPTVITGLNNILYGYDISESELILTSQRNYNALLWTIEGEHRDEYDIEKFIVSAKDNYEIARKNYDDAFAEYKTLTRDAEYQVIEDLLAETVITARAMADTVKSENNLYDFWVDYRTSKNLKVFSKVTSYQSDIKTYTSKINSLLSSLLSQQRALEDAKENIIAAEEDMEEMKKDQPIDLAAAERTVKEKEDALRKLKNPEQYDIDDKEIAVKEKELALEKLKAGADDIDIRSKSIAVQEKYESLLAVQEKLAEHSIKAPFNGTVASVNISQGDTVNSGAVIGTVITEQRIIEITLNEIDIADVKVGQNATVNFDAVPELTATGKVFEVDTLGTVNQGVVSYKIKISFDVEDDRIKPGMSVSISVITSSKQDVLLAPIGAVKTSAGASYIEVLQDGKLIRKTVKTGLGNDTMIEIVEGVNDGEQVITQTINTAVSNQSAAPAQSTGGFNMGGTTQQLQRILR
ncbi:efflux RND transporter periplasmic adaptor subunit [Patescibacteria group bacterium]|nr:efflux RND transporter periplasmic adaptor subunit [Candidatus Falkowbacteria bacterium]MBU3906184.1 efflux RND transporter periplasmic adaptor subunit [Patescibacteria group bacterium]MBU4015590.1 efflux RND transporter periplasmic adaptor subunit [Patescibacteria group bacterium]MBU4026342.1 efflux RND transporter periplasmic adaptor subunit [Patescibacteria group bacterium]MBU4073205.1 efflux RND transporter periplasmic adaptor subunit [Patescibacteria group bacterium]